VQEPSSQNEINLFSYLQVLLHWKWFLLINTTVMVAITVVVVLLLQSEYLSVASIIPPQKESGIGSTISQLTKGILPGNILGKVGASQGAYNYLAILESRSAMEEVVTRNNLIEVYEADMGMADAVETLSGLSEFEIQENGNITVAVIDTEPERAAKIANDFVDVLNEISIKLNTLEAKNNRLFIEKRYNSAKQDMREVEDSLQVFQSRHGLISLPEQTAAAIQAAAELKSQITVAEIEKGVLQRTLGNENHDVALKQAEISEIQLKLKSMQFGGAIKSPDASSVFLPLNTLPELSIEYIRLYRDFQVQNMLLEFIIPLYEQAKVEENKTTPVVLVLDDAIPPIRKFWPPRTIIVSLVFFASIIISILLIMLFEFVSSPHNSGTQLESRSASFAASVKRRYRVG
jgi:uncharacterized protein involved in exopolysaccharide biosynthesis